jgi:RNA polymerase sigma-70 factor, ECF subfamily
LQLNLLIKRSIKKDREAQQELYKKYYPVVLGICMRYASDTSEAKDMLQETFIRIFSKLRQYKGKGSFEGWIKRVTVSTSVNIYKKNKRYKNRIENKENSINEYELSADSDETVEETGNIKTILNPQNININTVRKANFTYDELIEILKLLPEPYRIVFNLFIIEEYTHEEIAGMLNINIKTSWSRLSRAKKLFQEELSKKTIHKLND